ncbi:MAG TPA: response regulator [Anaeromyxobacter sp.]|nr:response regulator [Anaeromyxobacter sp.]
MKRILIVDDSRVVRELMKVYLIAKDVTILEAADGQEALAAARAGAPDLVIADMCMPRLDGSGLCAALWKDPATRGIPVLILTSNVDADTRRRAQAAGAREVLRKPIQPHALLDAVKRHVARAPDGAAVSR